MYKICCAKPGLPALVREMLRRKQKGLESPRHRLELTGVNAAAHPKQSQARAQRKLPVQPRLQRGDQGGTCSFIPAPAGLFLSVTSS